MPNQIIDIVELASPGPMGDVTPAAIAARDAAQQAVIDAANEKAGAKEFRDQAEVYSATTVTLQDSAISGRINAPGSATSLALNGGFVSRSEDQDIAGFKEFRDPVGIRPTGAGQVVWNDPGSKALFELNQGGAAALFHLTTAPGVDTAPIRLGVDHDGNFGLILSIKQAGTGIAWNVEESSSGIGARGTVLGTGTGLLMQQGSAASGDLVKLKNTFGGTGNILTWDSAVSDGRITPAGNLEIAGTVAYAQVQHASDPAVSNRVRMHVDSGTTLFTFNHYAGSGSGTPLHFTTLISTSGDTWRIRKSAAAQIGSEAYVDMIALQGTTHIGFLGATPSARRAATPNATDLATAITLVNALKADLIAFGLKAS